MSRRKQAKPRPIFAYDDDGGGGADVLIPISHHNGHSIAAAADDDDQDDDTDFREFAPLVMDSEPSHGNCQASVEKSRPHSPCGITVHKDLPDFASIPRPEPIKPTLGIPTYKDNTFMSSSNKVEGSIQTLNPPFSSSPVMTSQTLLGSGSSEPPSPAKTPTTISNMDESSRSSISSNTNVMRRGTKILPVSDEDGEKFICPVCNVSLLNLHDLTVHIRSHNTPVSGSQSNSCKICGKVLSSQSSLDRHMLVHSGERPFICKVCNMSFTTNGNMHRHSRIHTKEENLKSLGSHYNQIRRGKSAWRQRISSFLTQSNSPVGDRMKSFQNTMAQDILKNLPNHSQQSVFGRPSDCIPPLVPGMKRQFSGNDLASDWQIPFKRQSLSSESDVSSTSPRKFSYPMMPDKDEDLQEDKQEESKEREDKEVLHCPACPKTFLCKYGLESHLESHPNFQSHCAQCNLTFKTPHKLRLHRLISHTERVKEEEQDGEVTNDTGDKEGEKNDAQPKVGFNDLTFVDFSSEKFPLIAKHYFEENTRMSSSAYLNFPCKLCCKAFPCESSLILHTYTHTKDKCTTCPICECDYADMNEFHAHMLKHLSDKAFEDIRPSARNEKGDDDLRPDRLSKHDFLAMFLLKDEDEKSEHKQHSPTPPKKEVPKPIKPEKNINNDYFAKLGQAFAPGMPPMFGHFPMFPPGYQPTLDDFHRMLQIATNMNMLPSMGPGLLMQGLPGGVVPAHTSPSKPQSGLLPSPGMSTSTPKPAHSSMTMLPLSGRDSVPITAGPEREISEIKMMNSSSFPCKYCDNTFSSYKTLKNHIRTHLGFSPYQCNLCVYSSADKSSLIRHVRTHSGARPFQCLICDYAFTTRANCERHIRTKHSIVERDDIEKSVYLNKYALEASASLDNFHSPDTICKYCNVDFKFFRALKNHLRSNSSCRQKPYQCHLCEMAFCTKSNCLRHVQKFHPEINNNQIENYIIVFDSFGNDDTDNESVNSDDGIPLYTEERSAPVDCHSGKSTPQPPAAHSTPKPDGLLGRESRHMSPRSLISPSRHISPLSRTSPAVSPLVIKTEPVDRVDTPLDFSMKSNIETVKTEPALSHLENHQGFGSEETPMDLSVKKGSVPVPIAPKPLTFIQCMFCPMGFSDLGAMERHLRKNHSIGDPGLLPAHLAALNQQGKLLLPPKTISGIPSYPYNPNKMFQPRNGKPFEQKTKSVSATIQTLHDKLKQKRESTQSVVEPDLASVTKMIDATAPLNFQAFFNPDQSSPTQTSLATMKKTPNSRLPNIVKRPGVQISLEHCKAINRELDNLQREGDVDEAALSQVREMALSVKEEVVNQLPVTVTGNPSLRTASPALNTEGQREQHDENSTDGSIKTDTDKGDNAPKKKRNSYADSPHKLACPYCPRAFPWVSSLTRHLLTHTGQKPFKCPRCPVTFSTKSNRERHLIRKHGVNMLDPMSRQTMDRPFKCPLCVFSSFSTQSNLLKHYRDRHNGANLPENIADIERMSPTAIKAATLEMEIRARENPPKADDSSSLNMTTEEEEEDLDNSIDSSEKMEDDYAEMEMADDKADNVSEKSEKSSTSEMPSLIEKTSRVPEQERQIIAPHLLMAMPELTRMRQEESSNDSSERSSEQDRAQSPNTMKRNIEKIIAEQKAIIEQKTMMEMKIQAEIRAQIENQRKAESMSDSVSPTPMDISQDSPLDPNKPFTGSAERIINPERDNYDVDKITECWKCKEMFVSRKNLVRHLKEHNIDLPFKCYLCDASYESRADCLTHQADAHDSDWKILKDKNKVNDIDQFSIHMDKVVENNCNKLDTGSVLEIPGSGNDDSKMEVISADYMQRKVYCSLCPKRFWSLQDLRRHMRSHTGERPFECDICQKRFTLKHSMMRHRKKHAGAPPRSFDDDEDSHGAEERAPKPSKSAPNRNMTIFPFPSGFTSTAEGLPATSAAYLLSQNQMGLGSSNIANLAVAGTSNSIEASRSKPSSTRPSASVPTLDSMKKEFLDCSADMLHNLLGVESSTIEQMLDSADSETAAKYLGLAEVS